MGDRASSQTALIATPALGYGYDTIPLRFWNFQTTASCVREKECYMKTLQYKYN